MPQEKVLPVKAAFYLGVRRNPTDSESNEYFLIITDTLRDQLALFHEAFEKLDIRIIRSDPVEPKRLQFALEPVMAAPWRKSRISAISGRIVAELRNERVP